MSESDGRASTLQLRASPLVTSAVLVGAGTVIALAARQVRKP